MVTNAPAQGFCPHCYCDPCDCFRRAKSAPVCRTILLCVAVVLLVIYPALLQLCSANAAKAAFDSSQKIFHEQAASAGYAYQTTQDGKNILLWADPPRVYEQKLNDQLRDMRRLVELIEKQRQQITLYDTEVQLYRQELAELRQTLTETQPPEFIYVSPEEMQSVSDVIASDGVLAAAPPVASDTEPVASAIVSDTVATTCLTTKVTAPAKKKWFQFWK